MLVRPAGSDDHDAIRTLVEDAFGQADEAGLVDRLRLSGDAAIELVAVDDSTIV